MKLFSQVRRCLVVGAMLGLLMPQASFGGERHFRAPISDVALQRAGTLHGAVVSAEGQHAVGQAVSLAANGEVVARAVVGTDGRFMVDGLRPGIYSVSVGESQSVVRLWSEEAAPPAATPELLLVGQQSPVVRAKGKGGAHLPQFDHPFLVGGMLIAAGVIGGVIGYNIRDFDPAS